MLTTINKILRGVPPPSIFKYPGQASAGTEPSTLILAQKLAKRWFLTGYLKMQHKAEPAYQHISHSKVQGQWKPFDSPSLPETLPAPDSKKEPKAILKFMFTKKKVAPLRFNPKYPVDS
jgi:hypothetical protein